MSSLRLFVAPILSGLMVIAASCGLGTSSRESQTLDAIEFAAGWEVVDRRPAEPGGGMSIALSSADRSPANDLSTILADLDAVVLRFDSSIENGNLGGGVLSGFPDGCYVFFELIGPEFDERPGLWPPKAVVVVSSFCDLVVVD